MNTITKYKHYN